MPRNPSPAKQKPRRCRHRDVYVRYRGNRYVVECLLCPAWRPYGEATKRWAYPSATTQAKGRKP